MLRHTLQNLKPDDCTGLLLPFLYCWTLKIFRNININSLSYHVKFGVVYLYGSESEMNTLMLPIHPTFFFHRFIVWQNKIVISTVPYSF